jgi:hypothetical protein
MASVDICSRIKTASRAYIQTALLKILNNKDCSDAVVKTMGSSPGRGGTFT